MCSIIEDSLQGPEKEKCKTVSLICKKCKEATSVVNLRVKDSYCKECFLKSSTHKFRSTLGKHKIIRPGDRVLVGFSGSASSVALLHLLKTGFDEVTSKKVVYAPILLIIDESAVFEQWNESALVQYVKNHSDFEVHTIALENGLKDDENECRLDEERNSEEERKKICKILSAAKENSAKEYVLNAIRRKTLISAARNLKCPKIMTAETSTSLAISLLSGIAMGRGRNLPFDVAFLDDRMEDISVIRPMREFSRKEIVLCNRLNGLDNFFVPALGTKSSDKLFSIEKLTEDFVVGLQEDFPGTISTIFRTGDKLLSDKIENESCILCDGQIDTSIQEPCSLLATKFSEFISSRKLGGDETLALDLTCSGGDTEQCGNTKTCCRESNKSSDIEKELCYCCQIVLSKMETVPDFLTEKAEVRRRRKIMKSEIQGFLL